LFIDYDEIVIVFLNVIVVLLIEMNSSIRNVNGLDQLLIDYVWIDYDL
jgi:hypothetical protein